MFTGIIETTGRVVAIDKEGSNLRFSIDCPFTNELKVDQSVSHNGVCLTVVAIKGSAYETIAIDETLKRSNFSSIKIGDIINLERSMKLGDRLDGHIVQGHVDDVATVKEIFQQNGSWIFVFIGEGKILVVEKGSICINGVSLTVVDSMDKSFSTAIIPYTMENTNFKNLKPGDKVNVEYDVIGKYVARIFGEGKARS